MMGTGEAARALDAARHGGDVTFAAVCTDSRSIKRGDLFVALKGEHFDGHRFLAQAVAGGAAAAMVDESGVGLSDSQIGLPLIVVKNTRLALGKLAAYWREKFPLSLVALTGSSGKTTVKEMLAGVLQAAGGPGTVLATRGNLNNDIGVPLTLLKMRREHKYAVIEMGMNHSGEIRYLSQLAVPDVALVINAGHAHIEYLGSEEAIARAKGEIFEGLKADGIAVINADERFADLWRNLAAGKRKLEFGIESKAEVTATYRLHYLESEIIVKTQRGEAAATLKAPGLHNVRNALAASAAAVALNTTPSVIAAGLSHFGGVRGRLQKRAAINGATLIDDTYNANPESVRAAIEVLAQAPGMKLLVLGDMGELGRDAAALHKEMGVFARKAGVDRVLTLGEQSGFVVRAFGKGAQHFSRIEDLLAEIENLLVPGVTMLVKGSRFMQMERVVRGFEVEPDNHIAGTG